MKVSMTPIVVLIICFLQHTYVNAGLIESTCQKIQNPKLCTGILKSLYRSYEPPNVKNMIRVLANEVQKELELALVKSQKPPMPMKDCATNLQFALDKRLPNFRRKIDEGAYLAAKNVMVYINGDAKDCKKSIEGRKGFQEVYRSLGILVDNAFVCGSFTELLEKSLPPAGP